MRLFNRGEPAPGHVPLKSFELSSVGRSEGSVWSECIGRHVEDKDDEALKYSSDVLEPPDTTDGVADGEKTITLTLSDASNSEGTVAVGRGGTDLLKTANVVIADVD